MSNYQCIYCNYDLSAHKPGENCPECGEVILAEVETKNRKIIKYEDKLLSKGDNYVRNKKGALAFGSLSLLGVIMSDYVLPTFTPAQITDNFGYLLISFFFSCIFWFVLAYGMHARVKHVESILHYRSLLEKQNTDVMAN